jgi:hypothetical protein
MKREPTKFLEPTSEMSKNLKQDIPDESRVKKFFPFDLTLLSELEEDAKQPLSQLMTKERF